MAISPSSSRALRILHVIHSLDPRSGGPSNALRHLVAEQVKLGNDVSILSTTAQSAEPWEPVAIYRRRIRDDPAFVGTTVHVTRSLGRRGMLSRYGPAPGARTWLRQHLQDLGRGCDIVHIHGVFNYVNQISASLARRYRIPYVIRPAGTLNARCIEMRRSRIKSLFYHLSLKRDLAYASFVHAVSRSEAEELEGWVDRDRIRVVPHGVPLPDLADSGEIERFLSTWPELREKRIILYLSRVAPKKRADLLVAAVSTLRGRIPRLHLLIAGSDAGHMHAVQSAVNKCGMGDAVTYTGFLQGTDKKAAFRLAEVFVLPSVDENFGVAVIEAMAHGVPVLTTPGVAASEYVDRCKCGVIVDGSISSLVQGLEGLLNADIHAIGERGHHYVAAHLSWSAAAEQLQSRYCEFAMVDGL